jgi:hypothetical protein
MKKQLESNSTSLTAKIHVNINLSIENSFLAIGNVWSAILQSPAWRQPDIFEVSLNLLVAFQQYIRFLKVAAGPHTFCRPGTSFDSGIFQNHGRKTNYGQSINISRRPCC